MKTLTIAGFVFILLVGGAEAAEKYPAKPITVILPLESGSDGDIALRPVIPARPKVH